MYNEATESERARYSTVDLCRGESRNRIGTFLGDVNREVPVH